MRKRKVDKTKKSNIKCEHCEAWDFDDEKKQRMVLHFTDRKELLEPLQEFYLAA